MNVLYLLCDMIYLFSILLGISHGFLMDSSTDHPITTNNTLAQYGVSTQIGSIQMELQKLNQAYNSLTLKFSQLETQVRQQEMQLALKETQLIQQEIQLTAQQTKLQNQITKLNEQDKTLSQHQHQLAIKNTELAAIKHQLGGHSIDIINITKQTIDLSSTTEIQKELTHNLTLEINDIQLGIEAETIRKGNDIYAIQKQLASIELEIVNASNKTEECDSVNIEQSNLIDAVSKNITLQEENFRLVTARNQVAFQVSLQQQWFNITGKGQIIKMDSVDLNKGGDYNPSDGVFTCTVPGTYVFQLTELTDHGKHLELEMMKNNNRVAATYARNDNYYNSGSNSCITELVAGDRVFVRVYVTDSGTGNILFGLRFTTFSGFLLFPSQ